MSTPLLLAHRGAHSASIPENSFAAFDLALEHGCDGFEFDVRLTACGRALVCHDAKVQGITVSRAQSHELCDLPRLEEVLERYASRVFLNVELKVRDLESKVLEALRTYPPARDYVISSFLPEILLELKTRMAVIPLGLVADKPRQLAKWRELPIDYIIAEESLLKPGLVAEVHQAGRRIFVWTVNDAKIMRDLAQLGVDGLISDETELLVRTVGKRSSA